MGKMISDPKFHQLGRGPHETIFQRFEFIDTRHSVANSAKKIRSPDLGAADGE
jgi:hypothetical protein